MIWDFIKDNSGRPSKFDATSRLDGKIFGSEKIIIEGRVKGEILVNGSLEITQNAEINGNIKADKLFLNGKVEGNIDVADSLSVSRTAIIRGDIQAGAVDIISGAIISGQCLIKGTSDNQARDYIPKQHQAAPSRVRTLEGIKLLGINET